jgi:hypothetical protein
MAGIGVGEVAPETPCSSVEIAGPGWKIHEPEAFAVGGHMFPDRPEDAEIREPVLARDVERERARE